MADIAIIGGGAAGAAVFGALLRRHGHGHTIHWISGDAAAPGRGVAYASDDPRHLLNVRAAGMGLFVEHGDDFLRHAERHLGPVQGSDFLPRGLFGDFIETQLHARMNEARARGLRFALHREQAHAVHRIARAGYRIQLAHGGTLDVGDIVLAIGALAPRPLKTVAADALASGRYILDPWSAPEPPIAPRRIVVIGTGLTAVDTLVCASARWPHAELVAVSRHGLLPFRHAPKPLAPFPYQDDLNTALLACDGTAPMLRRVREAIADPAGTDWRAVIDGMRPINARLWQGLAGRQRRQFLRHLRWIWEAARHRTAPASSDAVQSLIASGRLQVKAARVLAVEGQGPLTVHLRHRSTQQTAVLQADRVIQATGLDTAVAYTRDRLLAQLLQEGLAAPDALQLGLSALPDGQLLDADRQPQPGLYGIGSLLRGNLWECTAMPEIRAAADRLAQTLCASSDRSPATSPYPA